MLDLTDKSHVSLMIKSIENIYNNSKIYGKLYPMDLVHLNIIYKLLNSCHLDLSVENIKQLLNIYTNIEYKSKNICPRIVYSKHIQTKQSFVQAECTDCNNAITKNKVIV
jgi:hypothetical protein